MSARIELEGKRFGAWTVKSYAGCNDIGQPSWNCLCDCGTERVVVGQTLRAGTSVSCGCTKGPAIRRARTKHGQAGTADGKGRTREYQIWEKMKDRCVAKPNRKVWKTYGRHGIVVCERWQDFANFFADMGKCPEGFSLDRIDPFGNYEPSNCRWTDAKTQANNTRDKAIVRHFADFNERARATICMVV